MKNRYRILIFAALLAAFGATSCNSFLDELPDNRTDIDTEEKISKLLITAYPSLTYAEYTQLMSDDHDDIGTGYSATRWETYHTQAWNWQEITDESESAPKGTWEALYTAVSSANLALEAIEEMGNPESLNPQKGEALICRAFAHFELVNVFCQNYSEIHSATDLGIPYVEEPETEVNPDYSRGTVKEVYEKIERDLIAGLPLIDDDSYAVPKYHFNRLAAHAFAAEFYLFYKKWNKVVEHANIVLGENPESVMRNVSMYVDTNALPANGESRVRAYIDTNVEANLLIIPYTSTLGWMMSNFDSWGKRYLHNDLISSTETISSPSVLWRLEDPNNFWDDTFLLRTLTFTAEPAWPVRNNVHSIMEWVEVNVSGYVHTPLVAYSSETALLARAEAYVQQENYSSALKDINLWIKMRVNPNVPGASNAPRTEAQIAQYYGPSGLPYYTSVEPTSKKKMAPETPFVDDKQEAFIHALMHIRRIEFWGEGSRWFDVKRYNIEITRRQYRENSTGHTIEEYNGMKLAPRDPRMAVQLPTGVIAAGLTPNPR